MSGTAGTFDRATSDAEVVVLCDDVGSFLRRYTYGDPGAPVTFVDTELDGTTPYALTGPARQCVAPAGADVPVSTGVRAVTGTAAQDIQAAFPGLQSVTLVVLAGSVLATMNDGSGVSIPDGVTLTWSVTDTDDSSVAAAAFAGAAAGSSYLLAFTYKSSAAG